MSLRNAMRKAAGLLVEMPPEEENQGWSPTPPPSSPSSSGMDDIDLSLPAEARLPGSASPGVRTVEDLVRQTEGPNLDQVKVDEAQVAAAPALVSAGKVDFPAVYKAAGLTASSFTAEQMLEMLASLPPDLPLETRRVTVKAMLGTMGKSMGATPETVVADASRKVAALASFVHFMERKSGEVVSKAEKEIAELEAQIEAKRTAMEKARAEVAAVTHCCEDESERLDDVLEFFSLDTGPSRYAPPAGAESAAGT